MSRRAWAWHPRTKPFPGQTLDPDHPLSVGLTGAWLFNEGSGIQLADSARGRTNITLLNGPTWTGGDMGGGLRFTGASAQAGLLSAAVCPAEVIPRTDYTLAFRYRMPGGGSFTNNSAPLGRWASSVGWMMITALAGWRVYADGTNGGWSSTPDNDGKAHQVIGIKSGTTASLVIDGAQFGTTQTGLSATIGNPATGDLNLGNYSNLAGAYFNGFFEYIYLWSRGLSIPEAQWLYQAPYGMFLPPRAARSYRPGFEAAWAKNANRLISGGVWPS